MPTYTIFHRDGTTTTLRAGSFTKTNHEVLFYDGDPVRRRSQDPDYERAIAVFYHDAIVGFSEQDRVEAST